MTLAREIIEPKNDKLNVSKNLKLPHSPGVRAGDFIFLSGMVAIDPETGQRAAGSMAQETRQILANMKHMLESQARRSTRSSRSMPSSTTCSSSTISTTPIASSSRRRRRHAPSAVCN